MTFEKGTPEYSFFKTLEEFERKTYELDMLYKQNQAVREYKRLTNQQTDKRVTLMETVELYDRIDSANALSESLPILWDKLDERFDELFELLMKLGAIREKLNERQEIFSRLQLLIKEDLPEFLEERMNEKFGNEHIWKKELSPEFMKKLRAYIKSPTQESRDNILWRISTITSTQATRRSNSIEGEMIPVDSWADMTLCEIKDVFNGLKKKFDELRYLEIRVGSLEADLKKLINRTGR